MEIQNVRNRNRIILLFWLVMAMSFIISGNTYGQENATIPDTSASQKAIAAEEELPEPVKKDPWNHFDLGFTTLRLGGGYILDYVSYSQDDKAKVQSDSLNIDLKPTFETRDFRFLVNGYFNTKMPIQWKLAIMYDGNNKEWLVRETGLVFTLKKLNSQVFVGRTKEGFSMPKIMNGHSPWTMERQMAVDLVPIMADGIRIYTFLPKSRVFWTLAAFNDVISHEQKFSTFEQQYLVRLGWLPYHNKEANKLLHVAGYFRYGKPDDGKFRVRSRPESNPTPYFIDTDVFQTDHSLHYGGEIYFTSGPLQLGTEYYVHNFQSDASEDHMFPGGDISVAYMFTGESRPYNTTGNIYGFVKVDKPLGKDGFGAWEGVLRLSTFDLDDGSIHGGSLWRITPMVNWYMNKVMRMEFVYGYSVLDRFGIKGGTHFFQSRIQFTIG
jgi:phosphate-selective porin OprO/OprP